MADKDDDEEALKAIIALFEAFKTLSILLDTVITALAYGLIVPILSATIPIDIMLLATVLILALLTIGCQ